MLGKSIQTTPGMQKHINNWQILPVVFWVQIRLMPRAINSFLAAKDRRAQYLTQGTRCLAKSSLPCASTSWKSKPWCALWQKCSSSLKREGKRLEETQSQLSLRCWIFSQPGRAIKITQCPTIKITQMSLGYTMTCEYRQENMASGYSWSFPSHQDNLMGGKSPV